ncbi:MAG: D-alanine--D-alanine ligase family protein [Thermoanaerobaculia bacterium]
MSESLRTVLLFGGRSAEHDVSLLSARSVAAAAPKARIDIIPICIARDGLFLSPERSGAVLAGTERSDHGDAGFLFEAWARREHPDVVFPLVHGTQGEDGALQGYLEILGLPYVGSGVTASAIGMDKAAMKYAFAAAKLPMIDYVQVREHDWKNDRERILRSVNNALRLPYFVKPANGGSSIGITKVKADADLAAAVETALQFDDKVLVERGVDAREIEVSVLGNDLPEASLPGEIVSAGDWYGYEEKYLARGSELIIPAKLAKDKTEEIRRLAVTAFKAIGAAGFSRVDFFLERGTNRLYLNEINTVPGFTKISMYPKLWEATELKYPRLIERLVELGMERFAMRTARQERVLQWLAGSKPLS